MTHLASLVRLSSILSILSVTASCGDSLVSDPCEVGYHARGGTCIALAPAPDGPVTDAPVHDAVDGAPDGTTVADAGPDASVVDAGPDASVVDAAPDGAVADGGADAPWTPDAPPMPDASIPDAPVCSLDLQTDPDNCGRCGHVCASGLCTAGICLGEPAGHVVAIGHDYANYHLGMTRVLGNAIAIGASATVRVGWYRGSAGETVHANTHLAALIGLGAVGRPSTHITLATPVFDNVDVVVIEPQTSDGNATEAFATAWATPLHDFLLRGGVAVVLEGSAGTSYRFAAGAQLFTVAPPVDVTDQQAIVVAVGDAIAQGVPVPYLAEGSSVVWPAVSQPAIVVGGETLAFHRWVQ